MKVFRDIPAWREERRTLSSPLGLVATMGALHAGHLELVHRSRRENAFTAVTIFVNPTQFDDPQDLAAYPQVLDQDLALLEQAGVDLVLAPRADEVYPNGYRYRIKESEESLILCGKYRPGHFDGMLTVVLKLLNLVAPQRAYFGEKDFQQLELIRGMVEAFFVPVEIIAVPTVREEDGLALSSRNLRLSPQARAKAPRLNQLLQTLQSDEAVRLELDHEGFQVDYVETWKGRRLAAAHLEGVRLIDNIPSKPQGEPQ